MPQNTSPLKWIAQWLTVVLVSYAGLIVALGWHFMFLHRIEAGDIADRDYIAKKQISIIDSAKTREEKLKLRTETLPVMKRDAAAQQVGLKRAEHHVRAEIPAQWQEATLMATKSFLRSVPLMPDSTAADWEPILYEFLPDEMPVEARSKASHVVASQLQPDMVLDLNATEERYKLNESQAKPIRKQISGGDLLIARGKQLNADDVDALNQMGISHSREIGNLLGIAVTLLAAFALFGLFLFTYEPAMFFSPSALALMATISIVSSGTAAAVGREFPQFVPLPATALILSVIFGRRVAISLTLIVVLFMRVCDLVDSAHLIGLAAAAGIALGVNITNRKELMLTGVLIGVMQATGYFMSSIFYRPTGLAMPLVLELVRNLLGGLSSAIVGIGSLPFLEIMFGILTPFRVAELSEPDQPLLRQLEEKAPGTYQHSLAVANLAEAGAKAIAADVNLVRAGAMYHDIGKMVQPRYFIENQLGDKNPHDEISPEESRARVLAHVTNGLELARKYGLPRQVKDFIPEHQGTTVMAYFYHKACVRDGHENVKESDYRYPGPRPQCKETAIVMLADVSEAVTHSMRDPSQEEVEEAIAKVFKARWDDGQCADSGLTPEELEKVKQGFVRVWRTLHHERLKYPSTTTGRMPVPPTREPQSQQAPQ